MSGRVQKALIFSFIAALSLCGSACAPVGSERWCNNLEEKAKGDWSANEAADYAKHCIIR